MTRHRATHQQQLPIRVNPHNHEALNGTSGSTHMAGHAFAGEHPTRILRLTYRARLIV
jgi:hypothetical protein